MIYPGDCLSVLCTLPDESVNCCITSPPYWGLRDYGVDGQLGLEKTPEEYVARMVEVFREVRRVLKDDGTLWLNLGDSYAGSGKGSNPDGTPHPSTLLGKQGTNTGTVTGHNMPQKAHEIGLKPKDLVGIPWMVAFALRSDGWYLRQDIIWAKPNPMPESVTDRCTKAHEYIFLMSKSAKYYYDADAIGEPLVDLPHKAGNKFHPDKISGPNDRGGNSQWETQMDRVWGTRGWANKKTVWMVSPKPFREAHFATFPPKLIEPCVLAGCPEGGIVLDPFFGAGTTGVVAKQNHRNYIGIELNPKYIEMAQKRIDGTLVNRKLNFTEDSVESKYFNMEVGG